MGKTRIAGGGLVLLAAMAGFFMLGVRSAFAPPLPGCSRCECREVGAWYDPGNGVAYALQINGSHVTNAGQLGIDTANTCQHSPLVAQQGADQYLVAYDKTCNSAGLIIREVAFKNVIIYYQPTTWNKCSP